MWPVVYRVALYVAVLAAPLIASALQRPTEADPFLVEMGTRLALLGLTILTMQFVVSARIKWVERPFGLDQVFRFHKAMAVFAAVLLMAHPALLAVGKDNWALLTSLNQSWVILAGKVTLFLLLVLAAASLFRVALRLEFQKWRLGHSVVAIPVLGIGFTHGFTLSAGLEEPVARAILAALAAFGALAYMSHILAGPKLARDRAFKVTNVTRETPNVWTIELAPSEGHGVPDYLPGQFVFLTLYRDPSLPVEEHPFTISSSPTSRGRMTCTIKESGDYTSTIGETKPGDEAAIRGPYGRFSCVLHPEDRDLVFISGGIGITPLMSMLRYLRDTQADAVVRIICFNKTESDIAFRDELSALESAERPRCRVAHVLSSPDDSWQGERGFPDRDLLARLIEGDLKAKAYYVCGPPVMMNVVTRALRELEVPPSNIYYERFGL